MKIDKTSFSAVVELPQSYDQDEITVDVELDKDEEHLTYDEVEDAIYKKVDELYHYMPESIDDLYECYDEDEEWPSIVSIVINTDDGSYPVISESMDDSELRKDTAFSKYLVLPDAIYSLTPEAELWMNLKKNGIIGEDAPFDFEKYHKMIKDK